MRALLPLVFVAGFGLFVRYAWADVMDAVTKVRDNGPGLTPPPPAPPPRPPVEPEPEDTRVFEPNEVLPPPAHPPRRTQYLDPRTPPPKTHVHPAERVMNAP